ncbi:MAG: pilus assembly protein TadG-related protein [Acidimicrobiales bacterium]
MPTAAADSAQSAGDRCRSEGGQVTAFVAAFMMGVVFVVALVYDGGQLVSATRRAQNLADGAARAAAQALDEDARRQGVSRLDGGLAEDYAADYLRGCDCVGRVTSVRGSEVTVEVTIRQGAWFWGQTRTFRQSGTADLQEGITEPIP